MRYAIVIIAVSLLRALPCWAQSDGAGEGAGDASGEAADDSLARAKEHFELGETHYRVGDFHKAADEYKEAYRLSQAPGLLFNIAQALRLSKDYPEALHYYRGYLRDNPNAENRSDVEGLIAMVQKRIADDKARRERAAELERRRAEAEASRLAVEADERARKQSARRLRVSGIATVAAGVALAGVGTAFLLRARANWQDINELADEGGRWTIEFEDKYNSAERSELLSLVFFSTGAGAVVAGAVLLYLGRDSRGESALTLAPSANGLYLVGQW